jgi:hypothetical protein
MAEERRGAARKNLHGPWRLGYTGETGGERLGKWVF